MRIEMLLLIGGMAAVAFFTRFAALGLFRKTGVPSWLNRWLKHIPTAMLTTLILPPLLLPEGELFLSPLNPYLVAGIMAALAAWRTRHIVATLTAGMAVMLFMKLVILA